MSEPKVIRYLLTLTVLEAVGLLMGLLLLWDPNPHTLALFLLVGLPVFFIGLAAYAIFVFRFFKRKGIL